MKSAKRDKPTETGRLRGNLLSPKRVAEMLDVALPTVYKWVKQRRIPHIVLSVGKRKETVRFRRKAIESWLSELERPVSNKPSGWDLR